MEWGGGRNGGSEKKEGERGIKHNSKIFYLTFGNLALPFSEMWKTVRGADWGWK